MTTVETARDRRVLAREAGVGTTSLPSIVAGTLVAFGAVGVVLAVAGAVGSQVGLTTDGISTGDWRNAGIAGAVIGTIVLLLAFFFGGYTAGRMSRRAGFRHGLGVFVLAALAIAVVAGLAAWLGDSTSLRQNLADNGVPTSANTWSDIGIGAAIAFGVAMLVGSVFGGTWGERWHGRLLDAARETRRDKLEALGPRRELGRDATTADVRDRTVDRDRDDLSVEEERERARTERDDFDPDDRYARRRIDRDRDDLDRDDLSVEEERERDVTDVRDREVTDVRDDRPLSVEEERERARHRP